MSKLDPAVWQQVLVRHAVASKRGDFERIEPLLQSPMEGGGATSSNGSEMLGRIKAGKRWLFAVQFEGIQGFDWTSLFSNACLAEALFEVHRNGRRMETLWLGVEQQRGEKICFFRHVSERKTQVWLTAAASAAPDEWAKGECSTSELQRSLRHCETGQAAFDWLCRQYALPLPLPTIQEKKGRLTLGSSAALKIGDWKLFRIHDITAGENKAAEQLAKAIDAGSPKKVQAAIDAGAPLDSLPETSVSPLMRALFRCGQTRKWRECAELLVRAGCPVESVDEDDSPLVDACRNFVPEAMTVGIVGFLLDQGVDINQPDANGRTVLYTSAVYRRADVVRFLMERGADPHQVIPSLGRSTLDEIRQRAEKAAKYSAPNEYAEILSLLG